MVFHREQYLSQFFFLIYINDITDAISSTIRLFANDSKIYNIVNNNSDSKLIQEDLDKLSQWSETWQLKFNVEKCKTLHFGNNNLEITYNLIEDGQRKDIPSECVEKDLGVVFETDLKFRKHINECINKANRTLGLIRRSFLYMSKKSFKKLYKTLVRSTLEYCNIVWCPRYQKDIHSLERVQKRATKLIRELRHLPYEERLRELDLPSLTYRRLRGDLIEVYKLFNNKEDININNFFKISDSATTRGHPYKLHKKQCRLDVRKTFSRRESLMIGMLCPLLQ